ncbi:hypothetical protein Aut01nite_85730 [Actinoplanes utahensis]|nr:hypothetical protein Aut01nite_85730 [Actinoplanes utahensis]
MAVSGKSFSSDLIKALPTNPAPPVTSRVRLNVFPIFRFTQRDQATQAIPARTNRSYRYYRARPWRHSVVTTAG